MNLNTNSEEFAYGTPSNVDGSYFSPATPTPYNTGFAPAYASDSPSAYTPSPFNANSNAYGGTYGDETSEARMRRTRLGSFTASPNLSETSSGGVSAMASPRQIGGPNIRRRMTVQHGNGQESWRQSVDEVFGRAEADDDAGEYLFAPQQAETVFQYPGTPAPGSAFSSPAIPASPFAMPMQPPTMSPDDMLRAYAAKHASTASSTPSPLARAEVVSSIKDSGMRVLYKPEDEGSAAAGARVASPALIRAGPGARVSR
ncbi:hypothetical protein B0H14DRAFT_3066750 [Mycena olivaceomarginata]|nr:hypothetical protein B0H14DRAFT_3066750 [Mycena olivaceomarginata]